MIQSTSPNPTVSLPFDLVAAYVHALGNRNRSVHLTAEVSKSTVAIGPHRAIAHEYTERLPGVRLYKSALTNIDTNRSLHVITRRNEDTA